MSKIERGTDLHVRRQITDRLEAIEGASIVVGSPTPGLPGSLVLTEGEGIDIVTAAGTITINADGEGIYVNGVSLFEMQANWRRLLFNLVNLLGADAAEGLLAEYEAATKEINDGR